MKKRKERKKEKERKMSKKNKEGNGNKGKRLLESDRAYLGNFATWLQNCHPF